MPLTAPISCSFVYWLHRRLRHEKKETEYQTDRYYVVVPLNRKALTRGCTNRDHFIRSFNLTWLFGWLFLFSFHFRCAFHLRAVTSFPVSLWLFSQSTVFIPEFAVLWPWTLTYDLDHRTWPIYYQDERACQPSTFKVTSFKSYRSDNVSINSRFM